MPSTITKNQPNRKSRRLNNMVNRPQPTVGISVQSVTAATSVLTIVFDGPVTLKGVPAYTTDVAGAIATAAVMGNPTTLELTFDQDVSAATVLDIPYEDPAVRNQSGGFVTPSGVSF